MKSTMVYKFHHAVYWRKVCLRVEVEGSAQQGSNVFIPYFQRHFLLESQPGPSHASCLWQPGLLIWTYNGNPGGVRWDSNWNGMRMEYW